MEEEDSQDRESLVARLRELERERHELHKDIEQLCMQQAGPAYLGVATRMHSQRTARLEQEVEDLRKKLAGCTRENQNLQEELSEAYRVKSQLADLHSAEVLKNVEAEKQLKFFQGCVAAAFAERDNAIMEAEKAKEKADLLPEEMIKSQRRVEELTTELFEEKRLATTLQSEFEEQRKRSEIFIEVIDKFYHIRQCSLEYFTTVSLEEKCECLLNDSSEMWRFHDDHDTSTADYINSLEAETETMRKRIDNLQKKLQVGLEIETHLKKKVREFEKTSNFMEEKIKKQISALLEQHVGYRTEIKNLLDDGYSELTSINDQIVEKITQLELSGGNNLNSSIQEKELYESECKDVHVSSNLIPESSTKSKDPRLQDPGAAETGNTSEALALALQEKVGALLLMSQQEERHLLEREVNAALQKKVEELQRNLLQVTNEKVRALVELARLKQEKVVLLEKTNQGKRTDEIQEHRIVQEKEGKIRNMLKRAYMSRWVGGTDRGEAEANLQYENPSSHMDFARMKIENATLKESLDSMEHLLSSVRRLRISLSKIKDAASAECETGSKHFESLDQVVTEANLIKTALGSSLPISWSAETDFSSIEPGSPGYEKMDFVSASGLEMVELLIMVSHILKEQVSSDVGVG